jgi:membrane associated rhomboid family serine protease
MDSTDPAFAVSLLATDDVEEIGDFSLVLSAADIPYVIDSRTGHSWEIRVAVEQVEAASYEIAAYIEENRGPEQITAIEEFRPTFRILSLFLVGCLALLYLQTGPWQPQSPWFVAGAGDSEAILGGQYYRLLTALSLHADSLHLLGNCLLGGILLHYYFHLLGNGIGLAGLLITATVANLLNVVVHGPGHHFVGFSTAVFAVIGILSSLNFRRHSSLGRTRLLMPLMAGSAMLAMVGSSGEHTDLGAHFFGLSMGLAAGYLLGLKPLLDLRHSFWLQLFLASTSIAAWVLAWKTALG